MTTVYTVLELRASPISPEPESELAPDPKFVKAGAGAKIRDTEICWSRFSAPTPTLEPEFCEALCNIFD